MMDEAEDPQYMFISVITWSLLTVLERKVQNFFIIKEKNKKSDLS